MQPTRHAYGALLLEQDRVTEVAEVYAARKLSGRLAQHPTMRTVRGRRRQRQQPGILDADWLREICLAAGADDVAFTRVDDPELVSEVEHVEAALPGTKSYISLVVK